MRKNHADSTDERTYSSKNLIECYARAEKHWSRRVDGRARSDATWKRGVGMAAQIWYGGGGPPSYAWVRLGSDGRFFFSSRRRHTRYIGDWSSDVCSSDLRRKRRRDWKRSRGSARRQTTRDSSVEKAVRQTRPLTRPQQERAQPRSVLHCQRADLDRKSVV